MSFVQFVVQRGRKMWSFDGWLRAWLSPLPQPRGLNVLNMVSPQVSNDEIMAGCGEVRESINEAGYGRWVSDAQIRDLVVRVLTVAAAVRK